MINNNDFSHRLKKVLEFYQLSASSFAEKIKVQRSSISHLLSGRNKPSLDFVLKVLEEFKEVELYWLLKGEGTFPKEINNTQEPLNFPSSLFPDENEKTDSGNNQIDGLNLPLASLSINQSNKSLIDKIVIFYKNGTFKQYNELD